MSTTAHYPTRASDFTNAHCTEQAVLLRDHSSIRESKSAAQHHCCHMKRAKKAK